MRNITKFILLSITISYAQLDNTKYVNHFVGTTDEGNLYPGATVPFGMVQLSPDTDIKKPSGYDYKDSVILGFSHTHLSGTGLGDFGDILTMPVSLKSNILQNKFPDFSSKFLHTKESARPGYYSVFLPKPKSTVQLTASERCGFQKYTFDQKNAQNGVFLNISHTIYGVKSIWIPDIVQDCKLQIEDAYTLSGYKKSTGWAPQQNVFFVMKFNQPISNYYVKAGKNTIQKKKLSNDKMLEAVFLFEKSNTLLIKTGISAVSVEGARKNLASELPDWDFEKAVKNAKNLWAEQLNKIQIEASESQKELFYTSLYHVFLAPNVLSDTDGKYFGPDFKNHQNKDVNFYSTFSLWDTYRAVHPLYSLFCPSKNAEFVHSMITHFTVFGRLPIWTLWGTENYCMTGNPAIPVIADAFLKGNTTTDPELIWKAVAISSSNLFQNRTFDEIKNYGFLPDYWGKYGMRGDRNRYDMIDKYGYIPHDSLRETATQLLELCYDDWCVAQIAKKMNKTKEYDFFLNRSTYYKNIFNKNKGFIVPKLANGTWQSDFEPLMIKDWQTSAFVEGNSMQYTFYVPHQIDTLIALLGGKAGFESRLDTLFGKKSSENSSFGAVTGFLGQYAHGNEPSHHIAYLYNYINKNNKTVNKIDEIMKSQYTNKPSGLSGNDDCGQMSAWYVFSAMGFYPVNPVSGLYDIGRPEFTKITLQLENGKLFNVKAKNKSVANKYVKSIKWNSKMITNFQLKHEDIMQGGTLEFEMMP